VAGETGLGNVRVQRHMPALDGLRAVAVMAVIGYHLGLGQFGGGYLGVDLFFVLSGFLITGMLVAERSSTGTIRLDQFWARRARRLFPALLAMLATVACYAAFGGPGVNTEPLWGDTVSTLFYVANWHFVFAHNSYFSQFTAPSPLEHTWSLAIEEQFYLAWPLLVLAFAKLGGRWWRRIAVASTAGLALASVFDMALFAHGSSDVTRAYFGTDSRAFELMLGALVALWTFGDRPLSSRKQRSVHGAGIVASILIAAGFFSLGGTPRWMFDGGFFAVAVLAAVVIASISRPDHGPLGALLSLPPVRWVGKISYGLYLWHWPLCVFLTSTTTGLPGWAVDVLRVVATFAVATVSFYVLEQPIRRYGVPGFRGLRSLIPAISGVGVVILIVSAVPAGIASADAPPDFSPTGASLFPLTQTPTVSNPLRVMFVGDSVMEFASTGLTAALQATHVVQVSSAAYPGWGLSTDTLWHAHIVNEIAQLHPEVVMGTWSYDRTAAANDPRTYRRILDRFLDTILAPGDGVQGVVFLEFPKIGNPQTRLGGRGGSAGIGNRQLQAWNTVVSSEAKRRPGRIGFLPVAYSIELDGNFSTWLPNKQGQWVRVRATDGFHLCPAGTARYAEAVLTDLQASWHLPATTRLWWEGTWTLDALYHSGGCPPDHP
jgi:peptidoglycan/LPS O-acetylase OafA/YrhL